MNQYIPQALRTDTPDYTQIVQRIDNRMARLLHGSIGIATESGELLDALKKSLMYGKPLDTVNLGEELGDVCWYMAIILDEIGMTFEQVMETNINKLKKRFPDKFTEQAALVRDLATERDLLEKELA